MGLGIAYGMEETDRVTDVGATQDRATQREGDSESRPYKVGGQGDPGRGDPPGRPYMFRYLRISLTTKPGQKMALKNPRTPSQKVAAWPMK